MEQPTKEFTVVTKKSNETIPYVMTSLDTKKELSKWAEFCELIFSYKPNPPSSQYFERHVQNDPLPTWIRVILSDNNSFAASVQTCQRRISTASSTDVSSYYSSGGIANVVTCPNHRQRGLVKNLLQDSQDTIMIPNAMDCSLLHCSPTLIPVYQSGGYTSVTTPWTRIPVSLDDLLPPTNTHYTIRRAEFPKDTTQLQTLHQRFSEQKYVGCIIRSIDYWNQYIANEIGDKLYVLTSNENMILAWMAIGKKGSIYKLLDFGMDTSSSLLSLSNAMGYLLHHSLQQQGEKDNNNSISVSIPTSIWEQVEDASWILKNDDNAIIPDDDEGWMYKMINPNIPSMMNLVSEKGKVHLIWPADSF